LPRARKQVAPVEVQIGRRLRELRETRGVTQAEVAEALGVNQSRISEYEQGGLRLHGAVIVALARSLRVSADELLGLDKTDSRRPKNPRLLRRLQRIEELPASERRAVLKILDSLLEKHAGNGHR
jgi:transcriptional regulator with XRE-family HTH domain